MSKFSIQMEGGSLDVYKQDIAWEWTDIRFSDGIRDQYSTDIDLPKTANNCALLGISGLLDSTGQLFGSHIQPCVLCVNGKMVDVYIQIVAITEDGISVCLFERTLPDDVFGKKVRDIVRDDFNSIYVWSVNTLTAYQQSFPNYNYGSGFKPDLAMRHPSRKLNDIISDLNGNLQGFTLPNVDDSLWLMAANKTVCPQNTRQVIEFASKLTDETIVLAGGQHTTNDLEGWDGHSKVLESSTEEFTFNRKCTATINAYLSWGRKLLFGTHTYMVGLFKNNSMVWGMSFNTDYFAQRNGLETGTITMNLEAGDTLRLVLGSGTSHNPWEDLSLLAGVLDIEYSNYDITDEDYGEELVYCNRHPSLKQWIPGSEGFEEHWFDGRTEDYHIYNWDGSLNQSATFSMTYPWRGISYFGYYCNIGDITIKDLYHGLCWLYGLKPVRGMDYLTLVSANDTRELADGEVVEIRPDTDKLGKSTTVSWAGGEGTSVLTNIDNEWLEDEVSRHTSPFAYIGRTGMGLAKINQYEITGELNSDGETTWDCKYTEPEGAVLCVYGQYGRDHRWGLLPPPSIDKMGFNKITQVMECTIKTYDSELKDIDYVYYLGRKFMVIDGDLDLESGLTTLTALLVTPLTEYNPSADERPIV